MKKEKVQNKKKPSVQIYLDPDLKHWLDGEREAARERLGGQADIKMPVVVEGKLRARMADEKKRGSS